MLNSQFSFCLLPYPHPITHLLRKPVLMLASEKILLPKLCSLEMIGYLGTKQPLAISDNEGLADLAFGEKRSIFSSLKAKCYFFQPYYPENIYFVGTCVIPSPGFPSLNTSSPSLSLFHQLDSICQYGVIIRCHNSILIIPLVLYLLENNSVVISMVICVFHLKVLRILRKSLFLLGL